MDAKEFEVGRVVLYIPNHAHGNVGHKDVERGVVTSTNESTVFVRFGADMHSKGCYPWNLEYEHGAEKRTC